MEREEVKVSLFVDDLSLYIKSPKDSTRKLTNAFIRVVGYKVNTQKSLPENNIYDRPHKLNFSKIVLIEKLYLESKL